MKINNELLDQLYMLAEQWIYKLDAENDRRKAEQLCNTFSDFAGLLEKALEMSDIPEKENG